MISRENIQHVAELASLSLDEEELTTFARELETIVKYVEQLASVDTEGVAPFISAAAHVPKLREDVIEPCLARDEVLAQAPRANEEGFVVPKFVSSEPT